MRAVNHSNPPVSRAHTEGCSGWTGNMSIAAAMPLCSSHASLLPHGAATQSKPPLPCSLTPIAAPGAGRGRQLYRRQLGQPTLSQGTLLRSAECTLSQIEECALLALTPRSETLTASGGGHEMAARRSDGGGVSRQLMDVRHRHAHCKHTFRAHMSQPRQAISISRFAACSAAHP